MEELVNTFHIDWKLLIAQIVNFGIVLGVLWWFALKPLMKVMTKRTEDIEKSLTDAKKIEEQLTATEAEKEKILTEAKRQGQILAAAAAQESEKLREEKVKATRDEMEKIVTRTKEELASEKEQMLKEVKQEVAGLVVAASKKVIAKEVDVATHKKLIDDTVNQANNDA